LSNTVYYKEQFK